jgi:hypothetical protein
MPDTFNLLRFQCTECGSALNLVAVDRTGAQAIDIVFLCYNCLIDSEIVTADKAVFTNVTGVKVART